MSMLKPAKNRMAYAKVGLYGTAGSGKTVTAAKIAVGLHKRIGSKKPIAMFDTEPAASFIIPLFEKAGIEFLVYDESRALADLMSWMDEAEEACDIGIIDSISHVWRDAQASYLNKVNDGLKKRGKREINGLEFHHWRPIKEAWAGFTDRFLSSKMHVILCGRAGTIYTYQTNDQTNKKELVSDGSRMATEKELGYEPSLLIEMVTERRDGRIINKALVEKDRSMSMNGAEVEMPDFKSFEGFFESLNLGGAHFESMDSRDSKGMFKDDEGAGWDHEKRDREIWAEEIKELLLKHFPSMSAEDKKKRSDNLEMCFDTRSWTKVEGFRSESLKSGYQAMRLRLEPPPADPDPEPEFGSEPTKEAA